MLIVILIKMNDLIAKSAALSGYYRTTTRRVIFFIPPVGYRMSPFITERLSLTFNWISLCERVLSW